MITLQETCRGCDGLDGGQRDCGDCRGAGAFPILCERCDLPIVVDRDSLEQLRNVEGCCSCEPQRLTTPSGIAAPARSKTHGTCDGCGATDTAIACWECERCELCPCAPGCINDDDTSDQAAV